MSTESSSPARPGEGRPITLTPVQPGLWLVIGGGVVATMGPLFGFLIGTMMGSTTTGDLDPIFLFLLVGILVGGVGVGMMVLGGLRLLRDRVAEDRVEAARVEAGRTASGRPAAGGTDATDPGRERTARPDQG